MPDGSEGSASATAGLLYIEAVVEMLRRKGVLDADDVQRAFIRAYSEAAKLPQSHISREKVIDMLGALQARARDRSRLQQDG